MIKDVSLWCNDCRTWHEGHQKSKYRWYSDKCGNSVMIRETKT